MGYRKYKIDNYLQELARLYSYQRQRPDHVRHLVRRRKKFYLECKPVFINIKYKYLSINIKL